MHNNVKIEGPFPNAQLQNSRTGNPRSGRSWRRGHVLAVLHRSECRWLLGLSGQHPHADGECNVAFRTVLVSGTADWRLGMHTGARLPSLANACNRIVSRFELSSDTVVRLADERTAEVHVSADLGVDMDQRYQHGCLVASPARS